MRPQHCRRGQPSRWNCKPVADGGFRHRGLAETAAVASLYPVATIVLAIKVLRERPSMTQGIGLLLAIPAVFLLRST
ncbi:EamA family transporter [Mesorhizobium sp. M1312]|uniref:EamA family transporter n=1 Tax=Mesorhizobium sp. M1312 TaxID=2957080 RepID=UPI003338A741